ncbi:hypothetical protein ACIBVL_14740 [Streptomyces sp. NPDC049687]|uniref:hypothetical protein n=1 Tax=Streptomyces sp. NPDC049687 TaxID=3365596 RepID=UPI0037990551
MIRALRALPALSLLPLLPLLLTACGDEHAGAAADPAELSARAQALGIAPELVYTTDVPGYTLAQQSVGVYGDDGFSASYFSSKSGKFFQLAVDRDTFTATNCPDQPVPGTDGASTTCVRDGDNWYRTTDGRSEYAVPKKNLVIRLSGDGVPRDDLRAAAEHAHRPTADELDDLLPAAPAGGGEPVERGDLPSVGDGAPNNDVGAGG